MFQKPTINGEDTITREPIGKHMRKDAKKNSNLKYQRKKISTWIVELHYNPDTGGQINIWKPGKEKLEHIWPNQKHDGEWYHKADEVHFKYSENAKSEYDNLETVSNIKNLMWRNR